MLSQLQSRILTNITSDYGTNPWFKSSLEHMHGMWQGGTKNGKYGMMKVKTDQSERTVTAYGEAYMVCTDYTHLDSHLDASFLCHNICINSKSHFIRTKCSELQEKHAKMKGVASTMKVI